MRVTAQQEAQGGSTHSFSRGLPCGHGLLCFRDPVEADHAVAELRRDYPAHCRSARELVSTHFDARRVLGDLLARAL